MYCFMIWVEGKEEVWAGLHAVVSEPPTPLCLASIYCAITREGKNMRLFYLFIKSRVK